MKTILFHRNYASYTGGHQKVRDYISHACSDSEISVSLFLNSSSTGHPSLFSNITAVEYQDNYTPKSFDIVFLAGLDWQAYLPEMQKNKQNTPVVINLIQHMRHGDPKHPLFAFLQYPAIRICVSEAVKQSIEAHANGPVMHIPMGHHIPDINLAKEYDLYILANKRPAWGKEIAAWAESRGLRVMLHANLMPKKAVLNAMAQSKISLCLPHPTEGFYLPGIEAMKLSDIAIVPDCTANRAYKRRFDNLVICPQQTLSVKQAIEKALVDINKPWHFLQKMRGKQSLKRYSLQQEKQKFLEVLHSI